MFQIIAPVGTFGAGKTTLVFHTLCTLTAAGVPKEAIAFVLNDEGKVDGMLADRMAEVLPMASRCFTCTDAADLEKALLHLSEEGKVEMVFLEGFGIVGGDETKEFLEHSGFPFEIVCVLDHRNLEKNKVLYQEVMATQVRAATLGVAITKYPKEITDLSDPLLAETMRYIDANVSGVPVFLVPEGTGLTWKMLATKTPHHHHHSGCTHCEHEHADHGHHHHSHKHHVHDEVHPHGFVRYHFDLRVNTTLDQIRQVFGSSQGLGIMRVKGAVGGKLFNEVHGEWEITLPDDRRFVTFYTREAINLEQDFPSIIPLLAIRGEHGGKRKETFELLRAPGIPAEETLTAIDGLLAEFPDHPTIASTANGLQVITHPEYPLQQVKEIARRPEVEKEHFGRVIERCVLYWVSTAEWILSHQSEVDPEQLPINLYELGISLAWWTGRNGATFDPALVLRVMEVRPGEMMARGLLSLKALNSDQKRAEWQYGDIVYVATWGIEKGEEKTLILNALKHAEQLSIDSTGVGGKYSEVIARLEAGEKAT
jgi:G3E family GTPase